MPVSIAAIGVGNFKAFADTQRVPLRPLTFIYGANSSGKSSILHSLILARHAIETGDLDANRTSIGGESVDLGGFRQYVHRRDISRRMEWSVELKTSEMPRRIQELLQGVERVAVSVEIGLPQVERRVEQDGIDPRNGQPARILVPTGEYAATGVPQVVVYSILLDGRVFAQLARRPDGLLQASRPFDVESAVIRRIASFVVDSFTTARKALPSDLDGLAEILAAVKSESAFSAGRFLPGLLVSSDAGRSDSTATIVPVGRDRRQEDIAAGLKLYLPRMLGEIVAGVSGSVSAELSRLQYLGPLRSYPPRHLAFAQAHDPNWYAGGGYAWDVVAHDVNVRDKVNKWLSDTDRLKTPYVLVVREHIAADQLEPSFSDFLSRLTVSQEDVALELDKLPPETEVEFWTGVPSVANPDQVAAELRELVCSAGLDKLTELVLIDKRSDTPVSHRDVGIGISQVLPVLVQAYASRDKLVAIEQPEIHLHPALQADLGDLFIESALGENKNRFLIETHSEHLLLRIMRRMRETSTGKLPEGAQPVKPEDVSVLFVEPVGSQSTVREMPLNERGELVKAWPGGFFEEGLREMF